MASRATLTAIARLRRAQEIEARRALEHDRDAAGQALSDRRRAAKKLAAASEKLERARSQLGVPGTATRASALQRRAAFSTTARQALATAEAAFLVASRELAAAERALDRARTVLAQAMRARQAVEAYHKNQTAADSRARDRRAERQAEDRWRPRR